MKANNVELVLTRSQAVCFLSQTNAANGFLFDSFSLLNIVEIRYTTIINKRLL
jgi:hypothetical protein